VSHIQSGGSNNNAAANRELKENELDHSNRLLLAIRIVILLLGLLFCLILYEFPKVEGLEEQ
jgi:hypothetical protein